jgi:flavodoxin
MHALIVFDTAFGNTERIALAMESALSAHGTVAVHNVADGPAPDPAAIDLLIVGGPTQRHGSSPALTSWLAGLGRGTLKGLHAAAFDTRYRMAAFLSGSAAGVVDRKLGRAGCRLVVPPESFFISRDQPLAGQKRRHDVEGLAAGEAERAAAWAVALLAKLG